MTVRCIKCRAKLAIPDDKADNPALKLKCPGCGLVFPLGKAPRVGTRTSGAARSRPAPAGAARATGSGAAGAADSRAASGSNPAPTGSVPAGGSAAAADSRARRTLRRKKGWRKCVVHPGADAESACQNCYRGYCRECGKRVQSAVICPDCEVICIRAWELDERVAREERRERSLKDEFETIFRFPISDPVAYVMLSVVVGFFGVGSIISVFSFLLQQGVLYWYAFHAVSRVANGDSKLSLPEFRGVGDLTGPLSLAFAAWLASSWPIILAVAIGLGTLFGGTRVSPVVAPASQVVQAAETPLMMLGQLQSEDSEPPSTEWSTEDWDDGEEAESDDGLGFQFGLAWFVFLLCQAYQKLYAPIALIVAAMSYSFLETLKPWVGFGTIQRMGKMYGEVLLIYGIIIAVQWLLRMLLFKIPIIGMFLDGFVEVYCMLAIGCLLGMAVDKKSVELGLD